MNEKSLIDNVLDYILVYQRVYSIIIIPVWDLGIKSEKLDSLSYSGIYIIFIFVTVKYNIYRLV
jgi:hypothetical protein